MEIIAETNKDNEYEQLKKDNEGKIHISFSEFSKFQVCGHKHLLEKYLKLVVEPPSIHLVFGNSIHKAIEIGIKNKSDKEKRVQVFKEDFTKVMMDTMKDNPDYRHLENYTKEGENIIRYLSTEAILEKYDVIGVEYTLYEQLFGIFYFKGFIDLIVRDKVTGRYVIIDWKTSGQQWDVSKKKKDKIFMAQMRFYKYFFAKKQNIPMSEIDCKYVVLNRLIDKNYHEGGYGKLQPVEIYADEADIEESLKLLAESINNIHIKNSFPKAKLIGKKGSCFFCPYKSNIGLCNGDEKQGVQLLKESRQKAI